MEPANQAQQNVRIRIRRQDRPDMPSRWEEFSIPRRPNANIISALQYIAAHPVTTEGKETTPVAYECNCLEEVCGACTMLINGKVRQACSALIDHLEPTYHRQKTDQDNPTFSPVDYGNPPPTHAHKRGPADEPITLEPLTKFPLVRDLAVDRSRLFNDLKRVKAWVPIDGTYDLGAGPQMTQQEAREVYPLSRCISCCACLEACPQYTPVNNFVGAAVFTQVRLFNSHPSGEALKEDRLDVMMEEGGIGDCSKAGNCVVVCPKEIPNLESIAMVGRQTAVHAVKKLFSGKTSR